MARRTSRPASSARPRRGTRGGGGTSGTGNTAKIILVIVALVAIGFGVWYFLKSDDNYQFQRAHLDKYVEVSDTVELLNDGASVYVDMSDGMNSAYATAESKAVLQAVIDKLAANKAIKFFGLADEKISPLEMSHTELYNYMLNPASYNLQKAPVEKTLARIVNERQPALLLTDFEEYKGGLIELAAYAKRYLIDWLAMGCNVTFYKWPFTEGGKQKMMFLAVFDDNANRLGSLVANAVELTSPGMERYVLGSRDFNYPVSSDYVSLNFGGNFHEMTMGDDGTVQMGNDNVTAVIEDGGPEAYYRYAQPLATATGDPNRYMALKWGVGTYAEYYPLGVSWSQALANAKNLSDPNIPEGQRYEHLLQGIYLDFNAQSGFRIEDVEVRTFDMQDVMRQTAGQMAADSFNVTEINDGAAPQINMMLTASLRPDKDSGLQEIVVDFDSRFNGSFTEGFDAKDLIRANIVISKASPEIGRAMDFFSWEGNQSLANSVKEALTASSSNPEGRVLYTYYLRGM